MSAFSSLIHSALSLSLSPWDLNVILDKFEHAKTSSESGKIPEADKSDWLQPKILWFKFWVYRYYIYCDSQKSTSLVSDWLSDSVCYRTDALIRSSIYELIITFVLFVFIQEAIYSINSQPFDDSTLIFSQITTKK